MELASTAEAILDGKTGVDKWVDGDALLAGADVAAETHAARAALGRFSILWISLRCFQRPSTKLHRPMHQPSLSS